MPGGHDQPQVFLTDLEVTYAAHRTRAGVRARHRADGGHLLRQIIRLFDEAVREPTVDVPKGLAYAARQQQRTLKQRLLCKRLQPLLDLALNAFRPGYERVAVLLLTGGVAELRNPQQIIQTASVRRLATRLERFIKKHGRDGRDATHHEWSGEHQRTAQTLQSDHQGVSAGHEPRLLCRGGPDGEL